MEYHERPGVYSNYALSSIWSAGNGSAGVAVAASFEGSGLMTLTSTNQAESALDSDSVALRLVRLLLMNGAGTVLLFPVEEKTEAGYRKAMKALLREKKSRFMICDTEDAAIQSAMKTELAEAAAEGNECIGVVGMTADTLLERKNRAAELNCERMVLTAGNVSLSWDETTTGSIYGAAGLAGVLAAQTDPALPVNGVTIAGISGVAERFTESEIDLLVQGGVTVLEDVGGNVSPIRAVTTRTTINGVADTGWRELTTVMIVDDVIPGIRERLKAQFLRRKNNSTTWGAIRSQVAMELENRKKREIIDSYGEILVEQDESDPTVCVVQFSFGVICGVSRIYLTAHITI